MPGMTSADLSKSCEECGKTCQPLPCSSNLESSEFYCAPCHKSHRMPVEVAKYMLQAGAAARQK
jgi:hypothetical protein